MVGVLHRTSATIGRLGGGDGDVNKLFAKASVEKAKSHSKRYRAACVVLAGIVGVLPLASNGAGAAASGQEVSADLRYSCQFPGGTHTVVAHLQASLPVRAAVDQSIQIEDVSVTLAMPRELFDDSVRAIAGQFALTTIVRQGKASPEVVWGELMVPRTSTPEGSKLTITASGKVESAAVRNSADLQFMAGDIAISLHVVERSATPSTTLPSNRNSSSESDPTTTRSPDSQFAISANCELLSGQDPRFATVTIGSRDSSSDSASPGTESPQDLTLNGEGQAADEPFDGNPNAPPDCRAYELPEMISHHGCVFMAGYSNVKKLNAAIRLGVPKRALLSNVDVQNPPDDPVLQIIDGVIHIVGHMRMKMVRPFEPARATFLNFGFMPVTASVELTQMGPIKARLVLINDFLNFRQGQEIVTHASMDIRLFDVEVNGVPLEVGEECSTVRPMRITLAGAAWDIDSQKPGEWSTSNGGVLSNIGQNKGQLATIPPFSGCGITEDLDPLITSAVSGPGNFVKMTTGNLCSAKVEGPASGCPPSKPAPRR